jgi:hypothetical protein
VQKIRQQKSALRCCVINYGLKSAARMTYFALMEASSEKSQKGLSEHSLGISKTLPYSKPNFFIIHTTLNPQLSTHNPKTTVNETQWCKKKRYPFGYLRSFSLKAKILPAMQSLGGLKHGKAKRKSCRSF